ncbi:hypothetical protein NDU88_000249 [Pleurodeles waltl]|uniref:Uncharacterized protein n=1 Tax=Pleurodeles waltl TaxID=8319 RepID=A0AAV7TEX0_PLEWA|nr:hypothetical protein NDU88_000249 [Pleurodeles waltl]
MGALRGHENLPLRIGGRRVGGAASRKSRGAGAPEKPVPRRSSLGGSPEPRPPALSWPGDTEDNRAAQEQRVHSWALNSCRPQSPTDAPISSPPCRWSALYGGGGELCVTGAP